jgi:hypothetical protein
VVGAAADVDTETVDVDIPEIADAVMEIVTADTDTEIVIVVDLEIAGTVVVVVGHQELGSLRR